MNKAQHFKHPRIHHLPWSESVSSDDIVLDTLSFFRNKEVVVSTKLDGENTTLYSDFYHARSLDTEPHGSRERIKALQAEIGYNIPEGWRVCGENMYAKHSIHYHHLKSYFYVHSIWNEKNYCLNYDETKEWCLLLGLEIVPELYRGIFDIGKIKKLFTPLYNEDEMEGYVIRIVDGFSYEDYGKSVGKYVRKNHVQTDQHWKTTWEKNELDGNNS